jgi:hypothetical protein
VAESLLSQGTGDWGQGTGAGQGAEFVVGEGRYRVVIVPGMRTIRGTTLGRLEGFRDGGGAVIFAGEVPSLVDAEPSERAQRLAERCVCAPMARGAILGTVEPWREVGAQLADGRPADSLLHQLREDGERRYLFLCNLDRERPREGTRLSLRGEWQATLLDTMSGERAPLAASYRDGLTVVEWDFAPHGHLLLELEPGRREAGERPRRRALVEAGRLAGPVPVTLSEPNALLLDQAEWRLDDGPWEPAEELLRLDNLVRGRLGYPIRINRIAQPWVEPDDPPAHALSLRFTLQVDVAVDEPALALEQATKIDITLDGQPVPSEITGWYVDEAIQTVRLPRLEAGMRELVVTMPYGRKTSVEWCYLLGDFGVAVEGSRARVTAPVRELAFGDWTAQGLPFYGGNVTYHCAVAGGAPLTLRAAKFRAPLLTAELDGRRLGPIAFAPFELELGALAPGDHALAITAYGSRVNTFGCVHNADEGAFWFGPNAWRTTGDDWSYEYRLKPAGLLAAPRLLADEDA